MTRKELIGLCLQLPGAYEDYPFDRDPSAPGAWTVIRHGENGKSFALIFERGGILTVNLKCRPEEADFLRSVFPGVTPAYHMNKEHWNSVAPDAGVPEGELSGWIRESYELTLPGKWKRAGKKP